MSRPFFWTTYSQRRTPCYDVIAAKTVLSTITRARLITRTKKLSKILYLIFVLVVFILCPGNANAEDAADGRVTEFTGDHGELIVARDGVVYWLSSGDELFSADVVRSMKSGTATIVYRECELTLPKDKDVILDNEFCELGAANEQRSMAMLASETNEFSGVVASNQLTDAPLLLGGTVLWTGGIASTVGGGTGPTSEQSTAGNSSQQPIANSPG